MVIVIIGVKDMLPHFTAGLHLKKELKPGEHISVGKHSGRVEKVNALSVSLRQGGKIISVPNSDFLKNPIERKTKK